MQAIGSVFIHVYAALAMVPYLSFFVIWAIAYLATRNKKTTTRIAMDLTFFLLIGSVFVMLQHTTGSGTLFWILVFVLLLTAGFVGREQNRRHGHVAPLKLMKFVSRSGFLLLSAVYVILAVISIAQYVASS